MASKLKDLELTEVSCVKAGANSGARILLAKTAMPRVGTKFGKADGVSYDSELSLTDLIEDIGEAVRDKFMSGNPTGPDEWVCICEVFADSVIFRQGMEDDLWRAPYTVTASNGENKVTVGDRVPVKVVYQDATSESEANKAKKSKGAKMAEITQEVLQAEIQKALGTQQADFEKRIGDVAKQLTEEREARALLEKRATDAEKTAADNAALAKAEKDERRTNEFVALGKSKYSALPGEDRRKGEILKSIDDNLPKEVKEDLLKMLDAANGAMSQMFTASGRTTAQVAGDAETKIEALSKQRASEKNISFAKAKMQVLQEQPELYAQWERERRAN